MKEAHLTTKRVVTRNQDDSRAFPLTEKYPGHNGTPESTNNIIDFLKVEKSARYTPNSKQTFCNVYAHDFARLMGAYIPRVWWTDKAIKDKDFDSVRYGQNVVEMNANALYAWFQKEGASFGWEELPRATEAQNFANEGKCVIAVAANLVASKSGHITAVIPESSEFKPVGSKGIWIKIVQSQAGRTNQDRFVSNWWTTGHKPVKFFVKK